MMSIECSEVYSLALSPVAELNNSQSNSDQLDSWMTEYLLDYATTLKERERIRPPFNKWSPQLNIREGLLHFLKGVSEQLRFSHATRHLAIYIIDQFMDDNNIVREPYTDLFAVVCLILAAKHGESESLIPKISVLHKFIDVEFTRQDFITLESTVMQHFNWRLSIPTAANFCEHHCWFAVFQSDSEAFGCSIKDLRCLLRGLTYDYLEATLSEINFLYYLPSKVAATCLRAARVALKLTPAWPKILEMSTGYPEDDLGNCHRLLMRSIQLPDRKRKSKFGTPESGYYTDSDYALSPVANKRFR